MIRIWFVLITLVAGIALMWIGQRLAIHDGPLAGTRCLVAGGLLLYVSGLTTSFGKLVSTVIEWLFGAVARPLN